MYDNNINRKNTASVKYEELEKNFGREDLLPFWVADMDIKSPEFLVEALKNRADHGIFGYTKRMPDYYDSIVNWLSRNHNFNVQVDEIEYGPGVVFLLNMMVRLFTNHGDKIIIQTPVYYPFYNVIKGNDRKILENPLVDNNGYYEMDFEDLEIKAKDPKCSMLILCSPHNPVGRVWKREELERLGKICIENNVLVVTDEIHFDIVYSPNKHIPFGSISNEFKQSSITCTAPSKTFNIAGLHSAYCVISNKDMMNKYKEELGLLDLNRSNCFSMVATKELYNNGDYWVKGLVNYLEENIDYVNKYLKENIKVIKSRKMEATYLMWLDCRELGLTNDELEDLFINKAKLALDSGVWFGDKGNGFMRLNIACPRDMLKEGLENLKEAIKNI